MFVIYACMYVCIYVCMYVCMYVGVVCRPEPFAGHVEGVLLNPLDCCRSEWHHLA